MRAATSRRVRCESRPASRTWQTIQITEADPDQRAALDELGHPADVVHRYPPGTMYFERAVANLRQSLDEMVRQRIDKTPGDWPAAFRDLFSRAELARVQFAVVGSVALAVRGVDVRPGDIDEFTTGRRGGSRS